MRMERYITQTSTQIAAYSSQLCYHGPTSAVHDPPVLGTSPATSQQHVASASDADIRSLLTSHARESRAWEDFALGSAAIRNDMPKEVMSKLLQLHWAWIAPMFMWVYRPAFMREFSLVL